jgi:valyl-tRNA synthetase
MRLLHPLMPFTTEEIWRTLHDADDSTTIQRTPWPQGDPSRRDVVAEAQFAALVEVVTELRRFRADHALPPATRITVLARADKAQRDVLEGALDGIRRLTGVDEWRFLDRVGDAWGPLGRVPMTAADLYVPLTGLIDLDEERARLQRELDRAHQEAARARGKLSNEGFVTRAPVEVVQAERDKVSEWEAAIRRIVAQLETLADA